MKINSCIHLMENAAFVTIFTDKKLFALFAFLVCNAAGSFGSRLARSLAFTAATSYSGFSEIACY